MEKLKRYRRELSLRWAKAEREGRLAEELRRFEAESDRTWQLALAEIRRENAAARRKAGATTARPAIRVKRTTAVSRTAKRKRA